MVVYDKIKMLICRGYLTRSVPIMISACGVTSKDIKEIFYRRSSAPY